VFLGGPESRCGEFSRGLGLMPSKLMCNVVVRQLVVRLLHAFPAVQFSAHSNTAHVPLVDRLATRAGNFAISISEYSCASSPIDTNDSSALVPA
jgi:hypothetical protein